MALFSTVWSSQEITNFGTLVLIFGDTSHQPKKKKRKNSKTLITEVKTLIKIKALVYQSVVNLKFEVLFGNSSQLFDQ